MERIMSTAPEAISLKQLSRASKKENYKEKEGARITSAAVALAQLPYLPLTARADWVSIPTDAPPVHTADFHEISQIVNAANRHVRCALVSVSALSAVPLNTAGDLLEATTVFKAAAAALSLAQGQSPPRKSSLPRNSKNIVMLRRQVMQAVRQLCRSADLQRVALTSNPDVCIIFRRENALHAAALCALYSKEEIVLLRRYFHGMFGDSKGQDIMRVVCAGRPADDVERLLEAQALQLMTKTPNYDDLLTRHEADSGGDLRRLCTASSQLHHASFGAWFRSLVLPQYSSMLTHEAVTERAAAMERSQASPFPNA